MKYLSVFLFLFVSYLSFGQSDRYPYVQSPTETTVIIAWRTAVPEASILHYGDSPTNLNQTLNDAPAKNKHHFTLTGLQPDTRYYYQVQSAGLNAAVETFETAKPDMQAPFTFLHYGDCGYNNAIQNDIAALMHSEDANFAVVSGDVDQGNGDNYDNIFFGVYKDMLKRECHFTSIGNHDTFADGAATYLDDFHLPTNNDQGTERYYTFTWGNAKFICLDSNIPYTQGSDQYNFLLDELSCNDRQWMFVFFHHPPWTNAWDISYYFPFTDFYQYEGNTDMRTDLVPLFEQYNVDFVLNGHSHCYQRGELNGVKYVISGGAGASILDDNTNSNSPNIDTEIYENQYVLFSVNGDTATYKCVNRDGDKIDEVNAIKAGFVPYSSTISSTNTSCGNADGTATVTANGPQAPYAVVWSTGATTPSITDLAEGNYQVTISGGCSNEVLSVNVASSVAFAVTPSQMDATCAALQDGSATVSISGGSSPSYLWSTGASTNSITGLAAGTYSLSISDGGCTLVESFEIQYLTNIAPSITTNEGTSFCAGAQVTLTADAGYSSYTWTSGQTGQTINVNQAGNYSVSVTDNQGCIGISSPIAINELPAVALSLTATETSCPSSIDGTISLSINSGTNPFTFAWSNGASTQNLQNLSAGNYSVTITDDNGCTATEMATVAQGSNGLNPTVSSNTGSFNFCENTFLLLSVDSGFDAYLWSTGSTGSAITISQSGNYTVSVYDPLGCTGSFTVVATEMAAPIIGTNPDGTSCPQSSDGAIVASASGGFSPYTYAWQNGVNTPLNDNLPAGDYLVTVTGSNGCAATAMAAVPAGNETLNPVITSSNGLFEYCAGQSLTLSANGNFDQYNWSTGQTAPSINISMPGTYNLTVSNTDGCAGEAQSVSVVENPLPMADFTFVQNGNSIAFQETADFESSYAWDFGDGETSDLATPTHLYENSGDYLVTLTVENDCGTSSYQQTINITISSLITPTDNPLGVTLAPNPFKAGTTLSFDNPRHLSFRLDLIGVDGRLLRTYESIEGSTLFIARKELAAGVYFFRLSGGGQVFVGKMTVD